MYSYVSCYTCGGRSTAVVSERGFADIHLCDVCLRGTVPEASTIPRSDSAGDRLIARCQEIRAEELRGPTPDEIMAIIEEFRDQRRAGDEPNR